MYRLFSRVPNGLAPMAKIVQQHIERMGNEVVNQREARINVRQHVLSYTYTCLAVLLCAVMGETGE
jgi:hypothetical protein